MTRLEVKELMKVITRYDNRQPSNEALDAWFASANIADWTLPEATEAVVRHFTYSTEYLRQAHVTALIEAKRNPPRTPANAVSVAEAFPALEQPPASEETRASALAAYREVAARLPEVRQIGRLPWSQQTRKPRTADDDVRARQEAAAELEARRPQLDELAERRARGEFRPDRGVS